MKVTNGVVWLAPEPLSKLLKERLPVKTSLALAKLQAEINRHRGPIEATRLTLVTRYGKENGKPGQFIVERASAEFPQFAREYEALMNETCELTADKIKLPTDVDGKPFTIEPEVLLPLLDFVEVGE